MCSANSFARPFQSHASGSRPRRELWKYWTKLDVCESFKCVKKIFFGSNAHFSDCPMAEQRLFLTCENAYPRPINCHSPPFPCTIVYTLSSTRDTNQIRVEIQRLEKWHAPDVGHDSHWIRIPPGAVSRGSMSPLESLPCQLDRLHLRHRWELFPLLFSTSPSATLLI